MKILGIETSCDETAAAVVEDGRRILANVVVSQIDIFAAYGGVIPEVAARSHLEAILPVIEKALGDAGCGWDEIDAIAVTHAPGLLGSLLIGTLTARTLAILHEKPLYTVHHLKSHVYANWLENGEVSEGGAGQRTAKTGRGGAGGREGGEIGAGRREPRFPLVALVVSGGHTQILEMTGHDKFRIVGTTRDDAVGECFDKVARILGLPYPGGPAIAKAAKGEIVRRPEVGGETKMEGGVGARSNAGTEGGAGGAAGMTTKTRPGDAEKYRLPRPKVAGLDFSFSGLKTAVLRAVQKAVGKPISFPSHELAALLSPQQVADFAASFQKTAVEILVEKLRQAAEQLPEARDVVLAGGVAANQALREAVLAAFPGDAVWFPAPALAGDNGAMVAAAAFYEIQAGVKPADPYKVNIYPRVTIEA